MAPSQGLYSMCAVSVKEVYNIFSAHGDSMYTLENKQVGLDLSLGV